MINKEEAYEALDYLGSFDTFSEYSKAFNKVYDYIEYLEQQIKILKERNDGLT